MKAWHAEGEGVRTIARRLERSTDTVSKHAFKKNERGKKKPRGQPQTISDERFAASRARQLASRGYGPSRIRNDLRQQKVDQYLSDSMSEAFDDGLDWAAEAASAYEKKYRGKPIITFGWSHSVVKRIWVSGF